MIKKTVTWTDFAGKERTEDWYFHLTKAELVEEVMVLGGKEHANDLQKMLQDIVDGGDMKKIMDTFKTLLFRAVGKRSADGSRFMKSEDILSDFRDTGAWEEVFMSMVTNPYEGAQFIQGMFPEEIIAAGIASGQIRTIEKPNRVEVRDLSLNAEPSLFPGAGIDGVDDLKPEPQEPPQKVMTVADLDALTDEELMALASGEPLPDKVEPVEDTRPKWLQENRRPTPAELKKMDRSELMLAYRMRLGPMSPVTSK